MKVIELLTPVLEDQKPARALKLTDPDHTVALNKLGLITTKPILYIANVADDDPNGDGDLAQKVRQHAASVGAIMVPVCARIEA